MTKYCLRRQKPNCDPYGETHLDRPAIAAVSINLYTAARVLLRSPLDWGLSAVVNSCLVPLDLSRLVPEVSRVNFPTPI